MTQRSRAELEQIRKSVAFVGRLSDGVFGFGKFSIGLDGVLSWIPGIGELYSLAAGGFILVQGVRAGVPKPTLALAAALMLGRTAVSAVPLAGPLAADLFLAHRWAARLVCHAIDQMLASGLKPVGADLKLWPSAAKSRPRGGEVAAH